jgi:hypothetical protein
MKKKLATWKDGNDIKACYTLIVGWFQAACTQDPTRAEYSIINTLTREVP